MKRILWIGMVAFLALSIPTTTALSCEQEPPVIDSTAYLRVAEIIREMDGDAAADEWLKTHEPGTIVLIEDSIELTGITDIYIGDSLIFSDTNTVLIGMGQNLTYALRTGTSNQISGMTLHLFDPFTVKEYDVSMTAPVRIAGGRGANPFVTVQSTHTALGNILLLYVTLYSAGSIGTKSIALQNINQPLAAGDILTVNWTILIGGAYSVVQRQYMAQAINPETAWGGTLYNLNQAQFVLDVGASGMLPPTAATGGTGNDLQLFLEWFYTNSTGFNRQINEFEVYNSNNDLVHENTGILLDIDDGRSAFGYHRISFYSPF